jgi:hypothetical protein
VRLPRTTSWDILSRPYGTVFVDGVLTQPLKPRSLLTRNGTTHGFHADSKTLHTLQPYTARVKAMPFVERVFRSLFSRALIQSNSAATTRKLAHSARSAGDEIPSDELAWSGEPIRARAGGGGGMQL